MDRLPDPDFFLKNNYCDPDLLSEDGFYSEAKVVNTSEQETRGGAYWSGNFFPDMRAWDNLVPFKGRGAGGHVVWIRYPKAPLWNHMSVFGSKTYKKGHRHGPGTLIVIPTGEGYSYMWPEGGEKVYIPWHEASVFVPPNRWFHQHFNVSDHDDRYLAFHAPRGGGGNERVEDLVLFRDKTGQVGLLADHCAHRGASLLYGRVEERGIACAYHGWLYDAHGTCLETPAEPADSKFHLTVRQRAYPVQRAVGLYWAYLGPLPAPALPRYDILVHQEG